jgi:hypothetical protein
VSHFTGYSFTAENTSPGSATAGVTGTPVAVDLRRQARLVDDLLRRVAMVIADLPSDAALGGWWGPAREGFLEAVERERGDLGREVYRLDGVRTQLEHAASLAEDGLP